MASPQLMEVQDADFMMTNLPEHRHQILFSGASGDGAISGSTSAGGSGGSGANSSSSINNSNSSLGSDVSMNVDPVAAGSKSAIIYWCNIRPDETIEDTSSVAGRNVHAAMNIMATNLGAPIYWGRTEENPNVVVVVLSKDDYTTKKYGITMDPQQPPWRYAASKLFLNVCDEYPKKHHVDLVEEATPALESPMTLLAMAFFQDGAERAAERTDFEQLMVRYNDATRAGTHARPGARHQYLGWSRDSDLAYASFDGVPRSGKAFYMISGWPSADAPRRFHMESGMEREASAILTGGADGWRIIHVQFHKVMPETKAA